MSAFDREKAREEMLKVFPSAAHQFIDRLLDALAGCVTDDPPTIDRDALETLLQDVRYSRSQRWTTQNLASAVLALLRSAPAQTIDRRALVQVLGPQSYLADRILALLRPDPRIAKLEALLKEWEGYGHDGYTMQARAILRGDA